MAKAKKDKPLDDHSTEEKIKQAARKVFLQKGYAATRTRDIAEEAGINLALLNYYFRSKEKLFDLVMTESLMRFLQGMRGVFNDESLSLEEKVARVAANYIDMLKLHPDLPIFVLSEVRANPEKLANNMGMKAILHESHFYKQVQQVTGKKVEPLHFIMNIVSLTVFPFVASPLLRLVGNLSPEAFDAMMEERKKLIPVWINAILKTV